MQPRNYEGWDFPGGSVVKNPPANEGDAGSIPSLGRIHMPQSNKARAPQLLAPILSRARAPQEANITRSLSSATESSPYSPQIEKAQAQQGGPGAAKNYINK